VKIGDIVRNVSAVRTNPGVWESNQQIKAGYLGIVLDIRHDTLNDPPLMDYVDVILSVDGQAIRLGNYGAPTFKVVA